MNYFDLREDYKKIVDELIQSYNGETEWEKMKLVSSAESCLLGVELKVDRAAFASILIKLYSKNIADLKRDAAKITLWGSQTYSQEKSKELLRVFWWCLIDYMRFDASFIVNEIDRRIPVERIQSFR